MRVEKANSQTLPPIPSPCASAGAGGSLEEKSGE